MLNSYSVDISPTYAYSCPAYVVTPLGRDTLSSVSREELDAKLGKINAETSSVQSRIEASLSDMKLSNEKRLSSIDTTLASLKATSSTTQWMVGAILALLAVLLAYPPIQRTLDSNAAKTAPSPTVSTTDKSPQPIIIQIPSLPSQTQAPVPPLKNQ
ncbi:hypothetical protein QLA22_000414 [Salmonella enterica]|uniref:hypothetical protein n=1 Tax=Salmonella enterica TaxID=28901 RepID=UPI0012768AAE|nr:hypothetical protein [Salmonella enterica]EBL6422552.1 hypothetical protein [Salmonella enterica subsp. enterica serovar Give]EDG7299893.1 hypothetical protein [Salmonella enterica subsp. enterica serovar Bareilly]EDT2653366.1 hypothetical protein [Salmonella enterica subsp. enterica]EDT8625059.1 hypothetical protein [Salmonella enterica subsp. enterica serovar Oranienburg]EDU8777515.1 hypothetical protein [Salmonella enterica subsp. enterica serovar Poona]EDV2766265.1 hypothetical protein